MPKCKCGAEIVFIKLNTEKRMPCESEPIKAVAPGDLLGGYFLTDVWLPHWSKCPHANEFRKTKKGGKK
jgi:hypothetical protein